MTSEAQAIAWAFAPIGAIRAIQATSESLHNEPQEMYAPRTRRRGFPCLYPEAISPGPGPLVRGGHNG